MQQPGSGPTVSPDGEWWWDGTRWIPMPRQRRGHGKTYRIGGGTLVLLVILAWIGLTNGPTRWDCTVQQNGYNMQIEYTGSFAGAKCDSSLSSGFVGVSTHSGELVCSYPIGFTTVTVWDTGLQILGSAECEQLKAQYDQQQQQQQPSAAPT